MWDQKSTDWGKISEKVSSSKIEERNALKIEMTDDDLWVKKSLWEMKTRESMLRSTAFIYEVVGADCER